MADEFLRQLRADWHRQDAGFADVYARLRRTRWRPHWALAVQLSSAGVALGFGVWFARLAFDTRSLLFAMSAAAMLLTAPAHAIAAIIVRKDSLRWEDETPAGVLRAGLRRAEAAMRAIRVGRWHVVMILVFVAALWITEAAGLIRARWFLVLYTAMCAASVLPYALWLRWRARRAAAERAICRRLLDDLQAEAPTGD